ncbi:MAG: phytoene/squalene synthase family protein [Crocinitomicaceae bacterium]|nr:phytoene/squalene synthase family protein [Crocinitomicaceae bacterium]
MKALYDQYSYTASKHVTKLYSTSFYNGVLFLDKKIRKDIHAIYGFVRLADEIVDSFHGYDKAELLAKFKEETYVAIAQGISLNPVLHAFQSTVNKYQIDHELIDQFLHSMEMDLNPLDYDQSKYEEYILGSAEVVGLMCLKIFVYGDQQKYEMLKPAAMKLGSAFQKINFLRDLKADVEGLGRVYFPNVGDEGITPENKKEIEKEIQKEFDEAFQGIIRLPKSSRFGVYVSYVYYTQLLRKIKRKSTAELMSSRIRVSNKRKMWLFAQSYVRNTMNLL